VFLVGGSDELIVRKVKLGFKLLKDLAQTINIGLRRQLSRRSRTIDLGTVFVGTSEKPDIVALLAIALRAPACLAQDEGIFLDGRWGGAVDLGGEGPEVLVLRLFPADPETGAAAGGLVDLPSRGIFGFPLGFMERNSEGISFSLSGAARSGAFFDSLFELKAGAPLPAAPGDNYAIGGTARVLSAEGEGGRKLIAEGTFKLVFTELSSRGLELGVDCSIPTGRGFLPGSFLMPERGFREEVPVVLLLSGADADRDGNNYSVPGRSDALAELAAVIQAPAIDRPGAEPQPRIATTNC